MLNRRRLIIRSCSVLLLLLVAPPVWAHAGPSQTSHYGVFMQGRKIGRMSLSSEDVRIGGVQRIRLQARSSLTIEMMGASVHQESTVISLCDQRLRPLSQEFTISSGGSVMRVSAQYSASKVHVSVDAGGGKSSRSLPIPTDGVLGADSSFLTLGEQGRVGSKSIVYFLNPLTVSLDKAVVQIEAHERVTLDGVGHKATRVLSTTSLGTIRSWEAPPGNVLWAELPLGMAMYRMDQAAAFDPNAPEPKRSASQAQPRGALQPPADFALSTSVATDRPIADPRRVQRITLDLSGIPDSSYVISDQRQRVRPVADVPGVLRYAISVPAKEPPDRPLPIHDAAAARYLAPAPLLDLDHPEIRRVARSLRDPKSARRTAERIRAWVHRQMTADYGIGTPRSAADVLRRKRGVCRDYAMLFAGLARAAGVPTRLVGGIVYANVPGPDADRGRFYYHAWVECWSGSWVAYDATLPTDFVDATHVKFTQGDPTDMMRVFAVVGKLKARVISVGS